MNNPTNEQGQPQQPAHLTSPPRPIGVTIGGMYVVALQLARMIERPGMTIDVIRCCMPMRVLSGQLRDLEAALLAGRATDVVTDQELDALHAAAEREDLTQ